jgi:hypothetical protein
MIGFDLTSRISDPAARMALLVAAIGRSPITVRPVAPLALAMMQLDERDFAILRWIASESAARRALPQLA